MKLIEIKNFNQLTGMMEELAFEDEKDVTGENEVRLSIPYKTLVEYIDCIKDMHATQTALEV